MSIWIFAATQSGQMSGEGKAGPPGGSSRAAFPQGGRGRGRFPGAVPGGDRFPGPAGPGGPPPPPWCPAEMFPAFNTTDSPPPRTASPLTLPPRDFPSHLP